MGNSMNALPTKIHQHRLQTAQGGRQGRIHAGVGPAKTGLAKERQRPQKTQWSRASNLANIPRQNEIQVSLFGGMAPNGFGMNGPKPGDHLQALRLMQKLRLLWMLLCSARSKGLLLRPRLQLSPQCHQLQWLHLSLQCHQLQSIYSWM